MVTISLPLYVSRPEDRRSGQTAHNCKVQLHKGSGTPHGSESLACPCITLSASYQPNRYRPINAIPRRRHISMPYTSSNSVTLIIISTLEALRHFVSRHKMPQNPKKSGKPKSPENQKVRKTRGSGLPILCRDT